MGLGSVDGFHPPQGHGRVARQVAPANNNFVVAAKRLLGGGGGWGPGWVDLAPLQQLRLSVKRLQKIVNFTWGAYNDTVVIRISGKSS